MNFIPLHPSLQRACVRRYPHAVIAVDVDGRLWLRPVPSLPRLRKARAS